MAFIASRLRLAIASMLFLLRAYTKTCLSLRSGNDISPSAWTFNIECRNVMYKRLAELGRISVLNIYSLEHKHP